MAQVRATRDLATLRTDHAHRSGSSRAFAVAASPPFPASFPREAAGILRFRLDERTPPPRLTEPILPRRATPRSRLSRPGRRRRRRARRLPPRTRASCWTTPHPRMMRKSPTTRSSRAVRGTPRRTPKAAHLPRFWAQTATSPSRAAKARAAAELAAKKRAETQSSSGSSGGSSRGSLPKGF